MINIDTIYQKVLVLANKEQRGYITPQEFNLLADKAQMDIYANYFHALKMAYVKPVKTQVGTSGDDLEMIQAKLHPFKNSSAFTLNANDTIAAIPADVYFIDIISQNNVEVVELTRKEAAYTQNNPLTMATNSRRVYVREQCDTLNCYISLYPTPTVNTDFTIHYYVVPTPPKWGYVVVNDKALYNNATSVDFKLHPSEEEVLVNRILELSGLLIRSEELAQAAMVDKQNTKQEQNS
jgi:hypothetical protein